jgi:hypothetical protein
LKDAASVFKIRVTNNGTENLANIVITDTQAPNCVGTITLPTTIPSTWSSLLLGGIGNSTDSVLEPGEWFEYVCSKENITENYTNSATVNADGVDS